MAHRHLSWNHIPEVSCGFTTLGVLRLRQNIKQFQEISFYILTAKYQQFQEILFYILTVKYQQFQEIFFYISFLHTQFQSVVEPPGARNDCFRRREGIWNANCRVLRDRYSSRGGDGIADKMTGGDDFVILWVRFGCRRHESSCHVVRRTVGTRRESFADHFRLDAARTLFGLGRVRKREIRRENDAIVAHEADGDLGRLTRELPSAFESGDVRYKAQQALATSAWMGGNQVNWVPRLLEKPFVNKLRIWPAHHWTIVVITYY